MSLRIMEANGLTKVIAGSPFTKADIGLGNVPNINTEEAIKSITRNGLTFTATRLNNTTFEFTQQDTTDLTQMTGVVNPSSATTYNLYVSASINIQVLEVRVKVINF